MIAGSGSRRSTDEPSGDTGRASCGPEEHASFGGCSSVRSGVVSSDVAGSYSMGTLCSATKELAGCGEKSRT